MSLFKVVGKAGWLILFGSWLAWAAASAQQRLPASTPNGAAASVVSTGKVPVQVTARLQAGEAQDVLVEFDSTAIETAATNLRRARGLRANDVALRNFRAQQYRTLKDAALTQLPVGGYQTLREYSQLPMTHVRLRNLAALNALASDARVKAVFLDEIKRPVLDTASNTLVNQPAVASSGVTGAGTTVAVIDTGVNYTVSDFGCTSPGVPAACKVSYYQNFADSSTSTDSNGHGTNVAGIVVGVAPGAKIAALNVFGANSSTSDSLIISAINWAIANQSTYNIVAINMSLGDSVNHGSGCANTSTNPYITPVTNARAAGIEVYVAAGNNGFNNGVSSPACTPNVIAVGAVYSANIGSQAFTLCTDSTTAADKIACFSNLPPSGTTSYKYLLAPGVDIIAGGYIASGTSQATPFLAGARALVVSATPDTPPSVFGSVTYYKESIAGVSDAVTRGTYSATQTRLDLYQSLLAPNDSFASAVTYSGPSVGNNSVASLQNGELSHAGNAGGKSVWMSFTPAYSGPMNVNTHNSYFHTLLGIYTGSAVGALTTVASNDDDGASGGTSGVSFQAQAATSYGIAVDGKDGASGLYGLFIHPVNDNFASPTVLSGTSGSTSVTNLLGSAETSEAAHAGQAATSSLWWTWTAPAAGQWVLDTHGSSINTVLDVEQGSVVSATTTLASNDDDGASGNTSGVALNVLAGNQYYVAVDSKSGWGNVNLHWNFYTSPQADLSVGVTGSTIATVGSFAYGVTLLNSGPAAAINAKFTVTLPAGVSYVSASTTSSLPVTCTASGQVVTCTVGTLLSGLSVAVAINVSATAKGTYIVSATASSDVTDATSSNNYTTAIAYVGTTPDLADAPTLPQWAAILLGLSLLAMVQRRALS